MTERRKTEISIQTIPSHTYKGVKIIKNLCSGKWEIWDKRNGSNFWGVSVKLSEAKRIIDKRV